MKKRRAICLGVCYGTLSLYLCGCGQLGDAAVKKIANEVIDELQRDFLGAEASPADVELPAVADVTEE